MVKRAAIFLSYASEDRQRVEALHRNLEAAGFAPWMDRLELKAGVDWYKEIQAAVERSDFFLSCISRHSLAKTEADKDNGKVLRQELGAALTLWQRRSGSRVRHVLLRDDSYLLPVRLEDCKVPKSLAHLQCVDLFDDAEWVRVARAVREARKRFGRRTLLVMGVGTVTAASGVVGLVRRDHLSTYEEAFSYFRHPETTLQRSHSHIGITVWRVREALPKDPSGTKILRWPPDSEPNCTQIREDTNKKMGGNVRLTIEVAQPGYLYVFDQESNKDGGTSPPMLLFPTLAFGRGANKVEAGFLFDIPPSECEPPFFKPEKLRSGYRGELITILQTPKPLFPFGIPPQPDWFPKEEFDGYLSKWKRRGPLALDSEFTTGQVVTLDEIEAIRRKKPLAIDAPPPQRIYSFKVSPDNPVIVQHLLEF